MSTPADLLGAVDTRCRAAQAEDAASTPESALFPDTAFGKLVLGVPETDRPALALWVQLALLDKRRTRHSRPLGTLSTAAGHLRQAGIQWPPVVLRFAFTETVRVLARQPMGVMPDPLWLPLAAAENSTADGRAAVAAELRWCADHADLRYTAYAWPRMRRECERLLPPRENDPYRSLTDNCPLADRLRAALGPSLRDPTLADVLHHCEIEPGIGGHRRDQWRARAAELLTVEGAQLLRTVAETALVHEPRRCRVVRRGRLVERVVWAEPPTMVLLYGLIEILGHTVPESWVDDLLASLATKTVLAHPARRGRRPPLMHRAIEALKRRQGTRSGKAALHSVLDGQLARAFRSPCSCADPTLCPHDPR